MYPTTLMLSLLMQTNGRTRTGTALAIMATLSSRTHPSNLTRTGTAGAITAMNGAEWADEDGDGLGDNADPDDDNDGTLEDDLHLGKDIGVDSF